MSTNRHVRFGEEEAAKALDLLWEIMRERGHGTVAGVERKMGLNYRTLHHWRRRGVLRYSNLLGMIDALAIEPGQFFSRLFPGVEDETSEEDDPEGGLCLQLLLQRREALRYSDPVAALELLTKHEIPESWRYCLAVGGTLKLLDLWVSAERWIQRALVLAESPRERASCVLRQLSILALQRRDPARADEMLQAIEPQLTGSDLAMAKHLRAVISRELGNSTASVRFAVTAILDPNATDQTIASGWQMLAWGLAEQGDAEGGKRCLKTALAKSKERWTQANIHRSIARIESDGHKALRHYRAALTTFGSGWLFEAIQVYLERTLRFGHDQGMLDTIRRYSTAREGLFSAIIGELDAASKIERIDLRPEGETLKRSWDHWKRSQLLSLGLQL